MNILKNAVAKWIATFARHTFDNCEMKHVTEVTSNSSEVWIAFRGPNKMLHKVDLDGENFVINKLLQYKHGIWANQNPRKTIVT